MSHTPPTFLTVRGARLHNLKNISLTLPKNQLIVFSGLSGSGKSTLAFDLLHKEGQRQYMESLGMVTYESRPPVDSITGLSPTISVGQNSANRSPRSTVGTASEVYTYLRVLFARTGHRPCPNCGSDVPPAQALEDAAVIAWEAEQGGESERTISCPACGAALPEMGMAYFSFNKPEGACPRCTGLGTIYSARLERLLDESKSLRQGAVLAWEARLAEWNVQVLEAASRHYGFAFDPQAPLHELDPAARDLLIFGVESDEFREHYPQRETPRTVGEGRFEGLVPNLLRRHAEHAADQNEAYLEKLEQLLALQTCPDCQGRRLRPEARAVTLTSKGIVEVSQLPLDRLSDWVDGLQNDLGAEDWLVAAPVVSDLHERLRRLVEVGLGYLTLERSSPSLSAGEARRLRLASLLGSGLTGVLYVLDEPTIGLHPRDSQRLVGLLHQLRDLGNTVLLVEHDLEVIAAADWLVDLGPGGGRLGGQVVAQGRPAVVAKEPGSITGQYLSGAKRIPLPASRRPHAGPGLTVFGANEHNLKDITMKFPQRALTALTGVSGSGKSTLLFDIVDRAGRQRFYQAAAQPGAHTGIQGWELFDKIITIDQQPIGRSTRSNAATYTEAFSPMRAVFAAQPAARERGLELKDFSFNLPGGRCERCEGAGQLRVEMHFLPDVLVRCPVCRGRRFKALVLEVRYRGMDISQVLDLTIEEALPLFAEVPAVKSRLELMVETGLGYLQLGQPASSFSGGEAQRVKLAKELAVRSTGRTLYLLDEPTTGMHLEDVRRLLQLLQRLVEKSNTV
ncbi:MAG: excinuclease ABC subunit A, partial [Chloroflexi bacterium RBG_16_54_18]